MKQYDLDEFVVRVYKPGEHFGVDDSVINDSKKSIVEFYHKKNGKEYFTASYYDKTLIDRNPCSGLILNLSKPELYIKPDELKELRKWLESLVRTN